MSETVLKILIAELNLVRIVCQHPNCGAVVEVPVEKLADTFKQHQCPVCKTPFYGPVDDHLGDLAKAIAALAKHKKLFNVEFVIPAKD